MEEGALDQAAEAVGKKVKKTAVSRQLFADLTEWRRELFRHLRPYNPQWSVEQIDQAVQRILDRLIFIRTCEDREIEPYRLQPMLRQWRDQGRRKDLVQTLNTLFREFDDIYDTRLFAPHFCEELTSELTPFEQIIEGLYKLPGGYGLYDFNAIDADVLGTIYEQYLGHRAQDPEGKQVVDKRAKRKAQGIYYTPQFVVRYIVGQTLGRLLEEQDYEQARQVKVLDMACGSGSFLIEAFDVLDRYLAGVRGQNAASAAGDIHDFARRMEILTGNLYGVDLDAQAVEIARLNLLLKAVNQRGELPRLENIRQGNSLIGSTELTGASGTPEELEAAFGPHWRDKHPFNWEEQFPRIMERGGFDVIVGNPPYIRIQTLPKDDACWYSDHYQAAGGSYDIYVLFVERALELLRPGGVFGMILPNKFFTASYGEGLRKLLSEQKAVWQVVDFEDAQVFEFSTTYTCLLFLRKEPNPKVTYVPAGDWLKAQPDQPALLPDDLPETLTDGKRLGKEPWVFVPEKTAQILDSMNEKGLPLNTLADKLFVGLQTSADAVYILDMRDLDKTAGLITVYSKERERTYRLELGVVRPLLKGSLDMRRYRVEDVSRYVIFPYQEGKLIPPDEFAERYPNCWAYLLENRERLEGRERGKMRHEGWYGYVYPKNLTLFEEPKLLTPSIAQRASFSYDAEGRYYFVGSGGGGGGGYGITLKEGNPSPLYALGLLNSRLLDFYLQNTSSPFRHGWYAYNKQYIERLPIRCINFDDPADMARHDRMVEMVEEMLRLQKEHAQAEALKEDRRHDLARRIEWLDAEIDTLVYELYGLTGEEIGVVEATDRQRING
jgi:type I restriction-modification system DNA methylase subunit